MKLLKKIGKWLLFVTAIPITYLVVAYILTAITVDRIDSETVTNKTIFLSTSGVHLDIVIHKNDVSNSLLEDLNYKENEQFLAFGWGDENFFINTPTWNDLTFSNAFTALFLKSSSLMHVTRYQQKRSDWTVVQLSQQELYKLNEYIENSFQITKNGKKIILANEGYASNDNFYKANGSYTCFNTCNTWVNTAFKKSGLKACYWTPFDFGLLQKYE